MRRIVYVIGNSHAACLKMGWDKIRANYPGTELIFFAHRGKKIADLIVEDNALVPSTESLAQALRFTSGGLSRIEPNEADLVLLYGMGLKIQPQREGHFSEQVLRIARIDQASRSRSLPLLQAIRSVSDVPILVGHDPMPVYDPSCFRESMAAYEQCISDFNNIVFNRLHARLVSQPLSTRSSAWSTKVEFTRDSSRLAIGKENDGEQHPGEDIFHMNEAFGELVLCDLLDSRMEEPSSDGFRN